jgi:hypothetical protein
MEEAEQQKVAENPEWLVSRSIWREGDSREKLEELGFVILGEYDDLLYEVQPPEGWTRSTSGYHTYIYDEEGIERAIATYKGAVHDRRANISLN